MITRVLEQVYKFYYKQLYKYNSQDILNIVNNINDRIPFFRNCGMSNQSFISISVLSDQNNLHNISKIYYPRGETLILLRLDNGVVKIELNYYSLNIYDKYLKMKPIQPTIYDVRKLLYNKISLEKDPVSLLEEYLIHILCKYFI